MKTYSKSESIDSFLRNCVGKAPGIRYREFLRMTGLSNGVLSYHLAALERDKLIRIERHGRITRYYPADIPEKESKVLGYMRHGSVRKAMVFLLENEYCTFKEIVEIMGKAPSTVSAHLKRLKDAGIVSVRYGETNLYRLVDATLVSEILSKYKESFTDKVVDNYIGMVDEF
jgi:predicted transcriptional regulator